MAVEVPPDGLAVGSDGQPRCFWGVSAPEYESYHDREWGFPVDDDVRLFEKLSLEGFQSGLSWLTILRKRDAFRTAFAGFDPAVVAHFGERDVERLMSDASIVRNRAKIEATIGNAGRFADLVAEAGSFARYVWSFEPAVPRPGGPLDWRALSEIRHSPEAVAMSKDLKRRGWRFVGPTTAYSFMEAMGLVNDHVDGCVTCEPVELARREFERPAAA